MYHLNEYKKGGETLIKFGYFLLKMKMKDEFIYLLSKFEHKLLMNVKDTLIKITIANICGEFKLFRMGSMYLFSAFS